MHFVKLNLASTIIIIKITHSSSTDSFISSVNSSASTSFVKDPLLSHCSMGLIRPMDFMAMIGVVISSLFIH